MLSNINSENTSVDLVTLIRAIPSNRTVRQPGGRQVAEALYCLLVFKFGDQEEEHIMMGFTGREGQGRCLLLVLICAF